MRITDNPVADAERWIEEQDKELENAPRCDYCGEVLYDYYFDIMGDYVCESCINDMKRTVDDENSN